MMTIIDDFSRKIWVYFPRHKNEAFAIFNSGKLLLKNKQGRRSRSLEQIMG